MESAGRLAGRKYNRKRLPGYERFNFQKKFHQSFPERIYQLHREQEKFVDNFI